MVNPLINDGHLIGFWPLHEPSGVGLFHNFSSRFANKPSGLSMDMKVHVCLPDTSSDEARSIWPGTTRDVLLGTSGVPHTNAYKAQGNHLLAAGAGEHHKVLILGDGGQVSREMLMTPRVAQSGFTAGLWVHPQSNGRLDRVNPRQHAKAHSLLTIQEDDNGWMIGVSGALQEAAQNALTHTPFTQTTWGQPNEPSGLAVYLLNIGGTTAAGNANEIHLNTPIESGVPTHITVVYRFVSDDGATNTHNFALFKNGRLAASGQRTGVTDALTLTMSNALYNIRTLCIGGSVEETDGVDRYKHATGWGHLVSGVYYFNRCLNEGEILAMHNAGGLQPFEGIYPLDGKEIPINDSKMIGHYPFWGPGYADASPNHFALISDLDEGEETRFVTTPGPFGRGGVYAMGGTEEVGLGGLSGLTQALVDNKSFTIAGWFAPEDDAHDFDQNMLFSMGQTTTALTGTPTEASMGFYLNTESTPNVRYFARFFPLGIHNVNVVELRGFDANPFSETAAHLGIVYDDQTKGVALYVDGELQQSGTLAHSLSDQVRRLAGSGFPLVFMNGVSSSMSTNPYLAAGGLDNPSSDFLVLGRPALAAEMRFLAQSGIRSTHLLRTVHDPRVFGYWRCNTLDAQALIIPDTARIWNTTPANLVRGTNDAMWDAIQATDNQGPWYRRDEFSRRFSTPPELASQLPLGITSGVWTIHGGSPGVDYLDGGVTEARNSSLSDFALRFRPFMDQRTGTCVTPYSYALSFEVTPSGNIRAHSIGGLFGPTPVAGSRHNSVLHYHGIDTAAVDTSFYSYLTNNAHVVGQNPGSSGVTIVFEGRDTAAASVTQLASGTLPFGIPSRILFHAQFASPYYYADAQNSVMDIALYINGIKSYSRRVSATNSRIWTTNAPTSTQYVLHFGGIVAADDTSPATQVGNGEVGLGEIYLRNIFLLKGLLSGDDIQFFATSGIIDTPAFAGYSNEQATTQVTTNHTNLQGYYRFSGGVSGELDLSLKHNDLVPMARIFETNNPPLFNNRDNPAQNLRYVPGPLLASDIGVQASGITYEGNEFSSAVVAPPFVASGEVFTRPDTGFAVGFWYAKRDAATSAVQYNSMVSFGNVPDDINIAVNVIDLNHSWAIIWAPTHNVSMYISQSGTGSMYLDPDSANAALSGTIVCGASTEYVAGARATNFLEDYRRGFMTPGHFDSWNHVLWSYDPLSRLVTCYMNGTQVDQKFVSSGVNLPLDHAARLVSVLIPQTGAWNWNSNDGRADINSILTDLCYFDAPITAEEARYIAFNGIDAAVGTIASGLIGGFIHGQDTGSGMIGGYTRGLETGSGMVGGFFPASTAASGMVGGYISGVIFSEGFIGGYLRGIDFGSGMIGGFLHGLDVGSGMIGSYIRGLNTGSGIAGGYVIGSIVGSGNIGGFITGSNVGSGIIGGFILGGLQNGLVEFDGTFTIEAMAAKDFDAQLELMKTGFADFDAKIVIFQDEAIPDVRIVVPDMTVSGLMPPFNQYFVGFASGRQGKTIEQTRWTFGDFTPTQSVDASGSVYYPIQHRYASSGFYIAKFEAIDSDGMHSSAIRYINAASGVDPVIISLSGVPRSGNAELIVDFSTVIDILPQGVSIVAKLLSFDDGTSTIAINPTHSYTEPGLFKPVWCVRDSRGIVWCDSLEAGNDFLRSGGA